MDEPTAPLIPPTRRVPSWLVVGLLISAALGLRLFIVARTAVAARDSVSFIRYAHGLETEPLLKVLREGHQAPGYPVLVMLTSWPVRAWRGDAGCDTMVLSCQLVTALMATLSIIPTFLLGREIGGRKIGWIAAGIVLCLPTWLRITSDGLSEGSYLFWLATALWLGVRGLRRPGVSTFAACGLASGMAYLTRPEGLEVAVAFGAILLGRQLFAVARQSWRVVLPQALALAVGVLVLLGPYASVIGGLSNKNTGRAIIGEQINDPNGLLPEYGNTGNGLLLATWFHESGKIDPRLVWAVKALAMETARAFDFFGIGLIAVGLATFRWRTGSGAALAALAGIVTLHAVVLCRMASLSGYLSERHTLLFVLVGSLPAAAGLVWLAQLLRRVPARYQAAGLVMTGLLVASPALTKPLHYNRAGHKAAGQWLAKNAAAEDAILDPFTWGEFYAGRTDFRTGTERPDRLFVIVETGDNQHSRLPHMADARAKITLGQPVYHWPETRPLEKAQVVVYAVPGNRLPDPATTNPRPEYRVGLKAASPTASVRSTAPGG